MQLQRSKTLRAHKVNVTSRYNDNYTGVRRTDFNEPRSYRLTTTLEF